MKNIAKILMVALLVIVATISVSAASMTVELSDGGTVTNEDLGESFEISYIDVILDSGDLYPNGAELVFTFNTEKMHLFSVDQEIGYLPLE